MCVIQYKMTQFQSFIESVGLFLSVLELSGSAVESIHQSGAIQFWLSEMVKHERQIICSLFGVSRGIRMEFAINFFVGEISFLLSLCHVNLRFLHWHSNRQKKRDRVIVSGNKVITGGKFRVRRHPQHDLWGNFQVGPRIPFFWMIRNFPRPVGDELRCEKNGSGHKKLPKDDSHLETFKSTIKDGTWKELRIFLPIKDTERANGLEMSGCHLSGTNKGNQIPIVK